MSMHNKKPWPLDDMKRWYDAGSTIQEIADLLSSDEWQPYWKGKIQEEYRPSQKVVNKAMKKHFELRGRGAPGSRNGSWKGGIRVDKGGYILVHQPDHPFAAENGCVRQHRLVAEQKLGRYLRPTEVVHHIDEDPANNNPENLLVFETNGQHIQTTTKGKDGTTYRSSGLIRWNVSRDHILRAWYHSLLLKWHSTDKLGVRQIAEMLSRRPATITRHLRQIGCTSRTQKPGAVTDAIREECRQFLATLSESILDAQA